MEMFGRMMMLVIRVKKRLKVETFLWAFFLLTWVASFSFDTLACATAALSAKVMIHLCQDALRYSSLV